MGRHKTIIPVAPIHELLKVEKDLYVSKSASAAVAQYLEELGKKIAQLAYNNALHRGKKTVEREDVILAYKQVKES